MYQPRQKIIAAPLDTKDACTHLAIYQKVQTTINTCKSQSSKDSCKAIGIKGFTQKFGSKKSGCSNGGAMTDKGTGFNQYTCFDQCRKAGKDKCNNFLIKDNGHCQLFAGTCKFLATNYKFLTHTNKHISGHNNKQLKNVSVDQCKKACIEATTFRCKSIDYYNGKNICDLSDKNKADVALSSNGGAHTNYEVEKTGDSKVFEVYFNNFKLVSENKKCKFSSATTGTWAKESNCRCGTEPEIYIR